MTRQALSSNSTTENGGPMPEKKLALPCGCVGTCGVALVTAFEPWGDDPAEAFVSFHQHVGYGQALWWRARTAWRVLRGKDPWTHDVSLDVAQMRDLARFLLRAVPNDSPNDVADVTLTTTANSYVKYVDGRDA
jgi:hypothetical protein